MSRFVALLRFGQVQDKGSGPLLPKLAAPPAISLIVTIRSSLPTQPIGKDIDHVFSAGSHSHGLVDVVREVIGGCHVKTADTLD